MQASLGRALEAAREKVVARRQEKYESEEEKAAAVTVATASDADKATEVAGGGGETKSGGVESGETRIAESGIATTVLEGVAEEKRASTTDPDLGAAGGAAGGDGDRAKDHIGVLASSGGNNQGFIGTSAFVASVLEGKDRGEGIESVDPMRWWLQGLGLESLYGRLVVEHGYTSVKLLLEDDELDRAALKDMDIKRGQWAPLLKAIASAKVHGSSGLASPEGKEGTGATLTKSPFDRECKLRWYRFSLLALDIIPDLLRLVFRAHWKMKYGAPWTDGEASGRLLVHGGPVGGIFDVALPGNFKLTRDQNEASTSDDVAALLIGGAPLEIGGLAFTVRIIKKTKSVGHGPIDHGAGHTSPGKIFLTTKHVGETMAGVVGKTASRWVHAATKHDGGALENFVSKSLETGQTGAWDTTALGCVLVGSAGCLLDWSGVDISDQEFWARYNDGSLVGGGRGEEKGVGTGGGIAIVDGFGEAHIVRRILKTRNEEICHRSDSSVASPSFGNAVRLYRVALEVFGAPSELVARFEKVLGETPGEAQLDEAMLDLKTIAKETKKRCMESLDLVKTNTRRLDELTKKPPVLHFVVQRYPALTHYDERAAELDSCLQQIESVLKYDDELGSQSLEIHLGPATRNELHNMSSGDRVVGGLVWAAIGFGDVPVICEAKDTDLSIDDFCKSVIPAPPFVVICFKHGASEAAKRLCELNGGAAAILWVKFDIVACSSRTRSLLEQLISPVTRFALERAGPTRSALEEKVQECGENVFGLGSGGGDLFGLELGKDCGKSVASVGVGCVGGGGEGGGKQEEEDEAIIFTGKFLEYGESKIIPHTPFCKPRNWGLSDGDGLQLFAQDFPTLKKTIKGLDAGEVGGAKMTTILANLDEIGRGAESLALHVRSWGLDCRSRAVALYTCRHFLHTRRFDVVVCVRSRKDLRRFENDVRPSDRVLCWIDLRGDGLPQGIVGYEGKGDDADAIVVDRSSGVGGGETKDADIVDELADVMEDNHEEVIQQGRLSLSSVGVVITREQVVSTIKGCSTERGRGGYGTLCTMITYYLQQVHILNGFVADLPPLPHTHTLHR
jgi:hypothetical protein